MRKRNDDARLDAIEAALAKKDKEIESLSRRLTWLFCEVTQTHTSPAGPIKHTPPTLETR